MKKFKLKGLPTESQLQAMPFGRQLDTLKAIEAFKASAKRVWVSQKRQPYAKAIKEAVRLYGATEYYCQFNATEFCKDDTFEFYYKGTA